MIIAALFASNVRQAFVKPTFLVMVMTRFHVVGHNRAINLEWDQRLSGLTGRFRSLNEKAAAGWTPAPAPGALPPASA